MWVEVLVGVVSSRVDFWKLFSATLDYFVYDCINVYPIVKPSTEKLWTYTHIRKNGILADRNIEKKIRVFSLWCVRGPPNCALICSHIV